MAADFRAKMDWRDHMSNGLTICDAIGWLNSQYKQYVGESFLKRFYRYDDYKTSAKEIPEIDAMIDDFSDCVDEWEQLVAQLQFADN